MSPCKVVRATGRLRAPTPTEAIIRADMAHPALVVAMDHQTTMATDRQAVAMVPRTVNRRTVAMVLRTVATVLRTTAVQWHLLSCRSRRALRCMARPAPAPCRRPLRR